MKRTCFPIVRGIAVCFALSACAGGSGAPMAWKAGDLKPDRVLYVAVNGSDTNDGLSEKTALKSIRGAVKVVKPGDLVIVKGGKYREHITIETSGTAEKPIVFRAAPNETVVVTWGWDIDGWRKVAGARFCYESSFPYAINMLWERKTLSQYLEVEGMELLDKQPGGFVCDRKTGKIFLHAFDGGDPGTAGIVAVPYSDSKDPVPCQKDTSKVYRWNKGFLVKGSHIVVDGFEVAFFPTGIQIREQAQGCAVRNNTVYGTTTGIATYNAEGGHLLEGNKAYKNSGPGIILEGKNSDVVVRNNFLLNNGHCPPFLEPDNGSGGHPYNLAQYGGKDVFNVSFTANTVISDDPSRRVGVMRCKGGVNGDFELANNVLVGSRTDLYPQPDSKAVMRNNTVVGGELRYTKSASDGREYKPELKDNISLADSKVKPCFADPSFYDFRLRKDSPFVGIGAYPVAGLVLYVDANAKEEGDGSTPEKALKALSDALKKVPVGGCVYMLPGTYKEALSLATIGGDKNTAVRNYGKGKVVLENSPVDLRECRNLCFDGIIFKNSKARLQNANGMEFLHCVFDGAESGIKAENCGLLQVINNTFIGNTLSADIINSQTVLRNNLFLGCAFLPVNAETAKTISENNAFVGENAGKILTAWTGKYPESHPSFACDVTLSDGYGLPDGATLAFAGLGWNPVGARGLEKKSRPILVEEVKALNILPDRVTVQWETPFDYPDVRLVCKDKNKKTVLATQISQGQYKQTVNAECVKGLNPNTQYDVSLVFTNPGGADRIEKTLTVATAEKRDFQPRTIFVAKTGDDAKSGLAANEAKKSIHGALGIALPGDTIMVAPGIYVEQNKIFIDGLSKERPLVLKSEKPGEAVLSANYVFDAVLSVNGGKYLTIDGFTFSGLRYSASAKALSIAKSECVVVKNCVFERDWRKVGGGGSNVQLKGLDVKDIEVSNCVFDSGFHGIWLENCNDVRIFNNTFWHVGINGVHVGCAKDYRIDIYNNIFEDVVGNHASPAVSVGEHGDKIICDYNIYWKTEAVCPGQKIYGVGGKEYSAPWSIMKKDVAETLDDARKMYGVESHGQFADPLLNDPRGGDCSVKSGSPTIGKGKDGSNIGADVGVCAKRGNDRLGGKQ